MSVGSDLCLLNKPVSVFPYLYSKRRSDPTKNNGQSQIATSVSSADFTMSLCRGTSEDEEEMTLVATAFIMLVAGYDTTGMTLSYLTHELAKNPEVQQRLQEEVDDAFDKAGGSIPDYYTIQGTDRTPVRLF